jgi:4-aminobutyrate aminotransferase
MRESDWELLERLAPGSRRVGADEQYWLKKSEELIAISTQSRDIYPVMDHSRGKGCWLYDLQGNEYLDVSSGVAVRALGVRYEPMVEFEREIAHVVEELPGQDFDHLPQVLLAERLISTTPGMFAKQVFFTTSGGRAVETAVKAAMDQTERFRFVAFRPAFHGRTGYALSLTASKAVHKHHFPAALPIVRVPYSYCYRCPYGLKPDSCDAFCADQVTDACEKEGQDIAGIMVEPVAGEAGIVPAHPGFMTKLRRIADALGAWLIVDEVQTGLGRTGKWWAIEHFGVVPDAICTAKALGAGWPLGATIARSPMFSRGSRHSETFSAEPRQALLSLFYLREVETKGYLENARKMGAILIDALRELVEKHDCVGDARGIGLMAGVEIVESKANPRPAHDMRESILKAAVHRERLLALGAGDNAIRMLPPLNVTEDEVRQGVQRLDRAITYCESTR